MPGTTSQSPAQTAQLARAFASTIRRGDVVLLEGDLGAGKTTFARAFCEALGVEGPVTSPTFGVAHRYDSSFGLIAHLDLHRLGTLGAFDRDLVDDELDAAELALVEWPSGAPDLIERATWRVALEHAGPEARAITIERVTAEQP